MAKQRITPNSVSQDILGIILAASDQLNSAEKDEQFRIFQWVERKLRSGKFALDVRSTPDGDFIKPTGANIRKINLLLGALNVNANPDRIKPAIKKYNEAAKQISAANQAYFANEFANYVHKPVHNIPLQDLLAQTADSVTRGAYTAAFTNPIRTTIFSAVQQGLDFQTLVNNLENQITGIVPRDTTTYNIRRGLLENYHYLKRVTRDAMFQASGNETRAVAKSVGEETVWYYYVGGRVDDTRDECIRRMGKRYFSYKEVEALNKMRRAEWPEKIPNVDVLVQRGGYNCLHQWRIVSARRVPERRLRESVRDGYITQSQMDAILQARAR